MVSSHLGKENTLNEFQVMERLEGNWDISNQRAKERGGGGPLSGCLDLQHIPGEWQGHLNDPQPELCSGNRRSGRRHFWWVTGEAITLPSLPHLYTKLIAHPPVPGMEETKNQKQSLWWKGSQTSTGGRQGPKRVPWCRGRWQFLL